MQASPRMRVATAGALLLAAAAVAMSVRSADAGLGTPHQLLAAPSFSPDGRTLAFYREWSDKSGVVLVDVATNESRVLNGDRTLALPSWSPDGSRLAVLRSDPPGLWVIDRDGSNARRLAAFPTPFDEYGQLSSRYPGSAVPQWSPSGRSIAYVAEGEIGLVDVDSGEVKVLTKGESPRFSPDGSKLAFVENLSTRVSEYATRLEFAVWTINIDGTGAHPLDADRPAGVLDRQPSWSPDSTRVAFERRTSVHGPAEILVSEVTSAKPTKIADGAGPTWSPSGQTIAFAADGVEVLDLTSGTITHLTDHAGYDGEVVWAPDGIRLAFSGPELVGWTRTMYVVEADGSRLRSVEHPPTECTSSAPFGLICPSAGGTSVPLSSARFPLHLRANARRGIAHFKPLGCVCVYPQLGLRDADGRRVRGARLRLELPPGVQSVPGWRTMTTSENGTLWLGLRGTGSLLRNPRPPASIPLLVENTPGAPVRFEVPLRVHPAEPDALDEEHVRLGRPPAELLATEETGPRQFGAVALSSGACPEVSIWRSFVAPRRMRVDCVGKAYGLSFRAHGRYSTQPDVSGLSWATATPASGGRTRHRLFIGSKVVIDRTLPSAAAPPFVLGHNAFWVDGPGSAVRGSLRPRRLASDSAGYGYVALQHDGRVEVRHPDDRLTALDKATFTPASAPLALHVSRQQLLVLEKGRLELFSLYEPERRTVFKVPAARSYGDGSCFRPHCRLAELRLTEFEWPYVIYVKGREIHGIDVTTGEDRVIRTARRPPVHARMSATALVYGSGRELTFVRRAAINLLFD